MKENSTNKQLIILVGPPGSGKTTYCHNELPTYLRISQDDMGKEGHMKEFLDAIQKGKPKIVVDRVNHIRKHRQRYIEPAQGYGYRVKVISLRVGYEECLKRCLGRVLEHATIKDEATARAAIGSFFASYEDILASECDQVMFI